jgi:hypothetical protein
VVSNMYVALVAALFGVDVLTAKAWDDSIKSPQALMKEAAIWRHSEPLGTRSGVHYDKAQEIFRAAFANTQLRNWAHSSPIV